MFQGIAANLKADPSLIKKVGGVFHFTITGGAGGAKADWTVDAKQSGEVRQAAPPKADCVITISDADMVALATHSNLNPNPNLHPNPNQLRTFTSKPARADCIKKGFGSGIGLGLAPGLALVLALAPGLTLTR